MVGLLWVITVILIVLWFFGFILAHVAGSFIHVLLIVALILIVWNLFARRRAL